MASSWQQLYQGTSVLVAFNATEQDYIEGVFDSDLVKLRVDQYSN